MILKLLVSIEMREANFNPRFRNFFEKFNPLFTFTNSPYLKGKGVQVILKCENMKNCKITNSFAVIHYHLFYVDHKPNKRT